MKIRASFSVQINRRNGKQRFVTAKTMGKKDTALDKTLQVLAREFVSEYPHPPDAAAQAIGRQLALHCLAGGQPPGPQVYEALVQPNLHPSVAIVFLQTYADRINSDVSVHASFLLSWGVQLEERLVAHPENVALREVLGICLHTYACSLRHNETDEDIFNLYRKLQLAPSRQSLLQASLSLQGNLWKPLFVATMLNLTRDVGEQLFCIRCTLRFIWTLIDTDISRALDAVSWFVHCMERLVAGLSNIARSEVVERLELAATAVLDIVEIGQILCVEEPAGLEQCTRTILTDILLPLSIMGLPSQQVGFICRAMVPLVSKLTLDIVAVFQLVILSLLTHQPGPIEELISATICDESNSQNMISSLATIHDNVDLKQLAPPTEYSPSPYYHPLRLLKTSGNSLIRFLLDDSGVDRITMSEAQQLGVMVFGLTALENEEYRESAIAFLTRIVQACPQLGRQILPVALQHIHQETEPRKLVSRIEFLVVFVKDPHCAQPVWKILSGVLQDPHVPLSTRMTITRILPKFVINNTRLYRRAIGVLGKGLTESPEMRLAVAATLHELAELDLIRDVSDVIGWIQTLLTEERSDPLQHLLVHYACLCLHALIRSQELEFSVVLQVLGKKLVPMNAHEILCLPLVIVESLVLLLGDGECDRSSSDEEKDVAQGNVSSQTVRAIDILLAVGSGMKDLLDEDADRVEIMTRRRILFNLYHVLAAYSSEALGVDEEGVKAVVEAQSREDNELTIPPSGERYVLLTHLVKEGLAETTLHESRSATSDDTHPLVSLSRKLLKLEENALGASIWQKHGQRRPKNGRTPSRALVACLPSKTTVEKFVAGGSSVAIAIARILSSSEPGFAVLRDNADTSTESSDPLFLAFAVRGFLNVASRAISSGTQRVPDMISEIQGWHQAHVSSDSIYLALASISIYVQPEEAGGGEGAKSYCNEIFDTVHRAFKDQRFENGDVAKISLGFIGASAYRRGALGSVDDTIRLLEQSVKGYGGEQAFGAYYGLSLICQAMGLHQRPDTIELPEVNRRICRMSGFLVEELLACFDDAGDFFEDLTSSVNSGHLVEGLIEKIRNVDTNSVALLMTKHIVARNLFISCAICLPSLAGVNERLLVSILYALETLEWGGGKGITLPPVLNACERLQLLEVDELDRICSEFSKVFDSRIDQEDADLVGDGLDDLFYAVNRTANKPTPHVVRQLLVGNQELFDDDGCVLSLVASVAKVCGFPCLGSDSFAISSKLDASAAPSDVKSIVKIASEAAELDDDSKYSGMGVIMLGCLCSLRDTSECTAEKDLSPKEKNEQTSSTQDTISQPNPDCPDFTKIPCPRTGTLAGGIIDVIEGTYAGGTDTDQESYPARLGMASLEIISLPKQFARYLLTPLLQSTEMTTTRASLDLLLSQISGRRKAAFDSGEFMAIVARLFNADSTEAAINLFGDVQNYGKFLERLHLFGAKLPIFSLEETLQRMWKICIKCETDSYNTLCSFLVGMKGILSSGAFSPKITNSLRRFLCTKLFSDIAHTEVAFIQQHTSVPGGSIFQRFIECLVEIPLSSLDEYKFFDLEPAANESVNSEALRALFVLELVWRGALFQDTRPSNELNRVSGWLASHLDAEEADKDCIRRVISAYASTCAKVRPKRKAEPLAALFEILLMTTGYELGTELLAASMAVDCDHRGSDGHISLSILFASTRSLAVTLPPESLEGYFRMILKDLASNIGAFCRREKASNVVFNLLYRLYTKWIGKGVRKETLAWLEQSLCRCRSGLTNEDAYTTHAISSLKAMEHR